jgi:hypothetical protein
MGYEIRKKPDSKTSILKYFGYSCLATLNVKRRVPMKTMIESIIKQYSHKLYCLIFVFLLMLSVPTDLYAAVTFPTLAQMLENINNQLPSLWRFVTGLAYVLGFFFTFKAVLGLKHLAGHRGGAAHRDLTPSLVTLFIGSALLFLPSALQSVLITVFNTSSPLEYSSGDSTLGNVGEMGQVLVGIIQFFGLVAFLKALLLFHKLGSGQSQQGTFGKAFTHLVGSVLCLNILGTASVIASTLGITGY